MEGVWKGLFEWSMAHQGDGTGPPRPMAEADRQWLETALKSAMVDLGKRMQDIKLTLDEGADAEAAAGGDGAGSGAGGAEGASATAAGASATAAGGDGSGAGGASLAEREALLDELLELVDCIDLARDLSSIGGLQTLLDLLRSPHPSLRWRAAEVAATCVQNNPPVQKAFMEGGIMPRLLPLLHDVYAVVQTKALMAISCMIRGYPPALVMLRQHGGLATLVALLAEPEPRLQRKCLQVLQYMLRVVPMDRRPAAADTPLLPALSAVLEGDDADLREAALAVAQQLAAADGSLRCMQQPESGFPDALEALQVRLDALPREERDAVQEEAAAAKQLAEALQRDLPPAAEPGEGGDQQQQQQHTVAVVDDSTTSGAPPAALQVVAVPAPAAEAPAGIGAQQVPSD